MDAELVLLYVLGIQKAAEHLHAAAKGEQDLGEQGADLLLDNINARVEIITRELGLEQA